MPVHQLRRRAGLSGNVVAFDLRPFGGTAVDHLLHDRRQRRRRAVADRASQRFWLDDIPPVVPVDGADDAGLDQLAAVRDRARGRDHLQRRDADLIAHRHRRQRALGPLFRAPHDARVLAGKIRRHSTAEPEQRHESAHSLGADLEADPDSADIARFDDDVGERQHAQVPPAVLRDRLPSGDVDAAGIGVDPGTDRHHPLFDRGRRGHDLERRARLVEILHAAIPPLGVGRLAERVRVERRHVRQRQNLSRVRIHHDGAPAGGAVLAHTGIELALRDVLQVLVDRELHRRTGGRRPFGPAVGVPSRVGLHEDLSRFAADQRIVRRLQAAEPLVIDAHPSDQMRRQFLVRIKPLAFRHEADAFEVELVDAPLLLR